MDREFSDYNKKGNHFNQFMGSSSSIGAKTVRNVCVAFRAAAEQNNRAGQKGYSKTPFFSQTCLPQSVFELGVEFSGANNVLLMSLMEETQEEEYYHGDDRLVSMIQSLEAEISDTEIAQMDDQDCSTSDSEADHWAEMNIISSLPFDEMNAWIPCGDEMMEHAPMEYEEASYIEDFQLCYGLFLQQQYRDTDYLAQGPSDK
ncbi:histidine-containing phosphotransfer protein [Vigna angularis]|uniref:Histidine-containing phosphotransfer protein n=1 Tax=Phaseolus angularis TaxID=3914 RepID=A0A8T0JGS3_PHAAN|nr:histidine-containing phosphotransfer protein [Vigna angularis]